MKHTPNESTQPHDRAELKDEHYGDPRSKEFRIIMQQWRECSTVMEKIYEDSRRDKKFLRSKQWDAGVESARAQKGVATSTLPLIRTYYNQKLGMALPGSIKFKVFNSNPRPNNDNDAAIDAANHILNGNLAYIDKVCNSEAVRNKVRKDQYGGGIGWLGLDYVECDNSMEGQIKIYTPRHFDQVYIHPYYSNPDASDAEYSFYNLKMPLDVAIGMFGDRIKKINDKDGDVFEISTMDDCYELVSSLDHVSASDWIDTTSREVTISYHHWRRKVQRTYYKYDSEEYTSSEWREKLSEFDEVGFEPEEDDIDVIRKIGWKCEQRIICGWTILEESDFFINQIPWTPCFGYTIDDGEEYAYHGIVHDAINLQETINWLESQSVQKISEKKTKVFVPVGTLSDRNEPVLSSGGVDYHEYDPLGDLSSGGPIQTVNSIDDGSVELQHLNAHIQILQEMMSTSGSSNQDQVINSAQQLNLTIRDRDVVREELDINYRNALQLHYKKVIDMILAVSDADDLLAVVELDDEVERVGAERLMNKSASHNYSVIIDMAASGTVQKQQAQQFAQGLLNTTDPVRQNMGLIISAENSELPNKDKMAMALYRSQFDQGAFSNIPVAIMEKIVEEKERMGTIEQSLIKMAQPLIQKGIEEYKQGVESHLIQTKAQAETQKHQFNAEKAKYGLDKTIVQAETAIEQDKYQSIQQQNQTEQDKLRVIQEFFQLQQEIASLEREGQQVTQDLINRITQVKIPQINTNI